MHRKDKVFLFQLFCRCYYNHKPLRFTHVPRPLIHYDTSANDTSLTKLPADVWLKRRMKMLLSIQDQLTSPVFYPPFYEMVLEQAYDTIRPNTPHILSNSEFQLYFKKYENGIHLYTRKNEKKILVEIAFHKGFDAAKRHCWILFPRILFEKIKNVVHQK